MHTFLVSNANTLTHTRTTVVIPDQLLIEAKGVSVTERTSVNELLLSGLRRELAERKQQVPAANGNTSAAAPLLKQG
jgi:hypothetical protein